MGYSCWRAYGPGLKYPLELKITNIKFRSYSFYKPQPLRTLEEIRADILMLEKETEGVLSEIIRGSDS